MLETPLQGLLENYVSSVNIKLQHMSYRKQNFVRLSKHEQLGVNDRHNAALRISICTDFGWWFYFCQPVSGLTTLTQDSGLRTRDSKGRLWIYRSESVSRLTHAQCTSESVPSLTHAQCTSESVSKFTLSQCRPEWVPKLTHVQWRSESVSTLTHARYRSESLHSLTHAQFISASVTSRPVATGGGRGAQPPLDKFEPPPRLRCSFCRNYRYWGLSPPPWNSVSPPPPANDTWLRRWLPAWRIRSTDMN